ncbi:hypothetical protein EMCRGX_G015966 [Ephydatia muelleri]
MEEQSKHLPLDSITEEISPRSSWIERKSYMLDEVDQLMDLMSVEKTSLLSRITRMETELKEEREHREGQMTQMEVEKAQWLSLEQQLRQEAEDEAHRWAKMVEAERTTTRSLKEQLSGLEEELVSKNKVIAELESFGQCQVKDLEAKLHAAFAQHKKIKQNLEIQSSENMTLKVELAHMQEKQRVAQSERKHLEAQLQECQQRCSQQSNEVLALKGRLTNSKKAYEKLQAQCSQLEAQSPKVIKVYTRRNEEERLLNECKKKDDLLASCVRETSYVRKEQSILLEQLRNMEAKWKEAEGEKLSLQSELKSHQSTVVEYRQRISNYESKASVSFNEALRRGGDWCSVEALRRGGDWCSVEALRRGGDWCSVEALRRGGDWCSVEALRRGGDWCSVEALRRGGDWCSVEALRRGGDWCSVEALRRGGDWCSVGLCCSPPLLFQFSKIFMPQCHTATTPPTVVDPGEKEFGQMKREMERKFHSLDNELSAARLEVIAVQQTLAALEQRHSGERNTHQTEQRGAQALLKESKEMIKWLNAQLERERLEHTAAIELMAQQWQQEMRKAVEDYGRMKEAGARRCAQLAKDLWDLKSKLDTT